MTAGPGIGSFAASPAETACTKIDFDVVLPRDLYYANDFGGLDSRTASWDVEARPIDDDGNPTGDGSWTVLGSEERDARHQHAAAVQLQLHGGDRALRGAGDPHQRQGHQLAGRKRTALDGASRLSGRGAGLGRRDAAGHADAGDGQPVATVLAAGELHHHAQAGELASDTGWSAPAASTSIAWALADVCRADYGAKLEDTRMDLDALYLLDQTWTARGDTFNAVFDAGTTVWEALERIARCGRAVPFLQSGVVRFIRDEQKSLPVALFSPRNIVKGSLKIEYLMPSEETADAVTVEWFNPKTWKPDETTQSLAGSNEEQPAKVRLFGCTDKAQADREASTWRRRTDTGARR